MWVWGSIPNNRLQANKEAIKKPLNYWSSRFRGAVRELLSNLENIYAFRRDQAYMQPREPVGAQVYVIQLTRSRALRHILPTASVRVFCIRWVPWRTPDLADGLVPP